MGLEEFRKRFPVFKAQGYAVMYYIFPYARCVVVELRKDNPDAKPVSRRRWAYRNRFWRKYGPALSHWIRRRTSSPRMRAAADDLHFYFLRQGLVRIVRTTRPGRTPRSSTIRATRGPTNISSACGPFARAASSRSSKSIAISASPTRRAPAIAATCRASATPSRADRKALLSYCWEGATLSIDPASTGGKEWEEFLRAYNDFCSARGGEPLFNQTPFLTREQAQKAFGERLKLFADYRRQADPENRLLDSYFRDLLA